MVKSPRRIIFCKKDNQEIITYYDWYNFFIKTMPWQECVSNSYHPAHDFNILIALLKVVLDSIKCMRYYQIYNKV